MSGMNYENYEDVVAQLQSAGLLLDSVKKSNGGSLIGQLYVESSKSVRCDVAGERKKQSGAYWLHELRLDDGVWLTGSYWVNHGNASFKIELRKLCSKCGCDMPLNAQVCQCGSKKSKARIIPPEQLAAHKARMEEARRLAEAEAQADAERAAKWADAVWTMCREVINPAEHDYLTRKKLSSGHGARLFEYADGLNLDGAEKADYEYLARFIGSLVVPIMDDKARLRGLQFILSREKHSEWIKRREGLDKEYWPRGLIKTGHHYQIGGEMRAVGMVAEGFATAATLREATNLPVAVAFDANNLGPVGEVKWKHSRKRVRLLYCADDDWLQRCRECKKYTPVVQQACVHCGEPHGKFNAGIDRARAAALATSGAWVAPQFSKPRPEDRKGPTDFNDLRCLEGEQVVTAQINSKLTELEWDKPLAGFGGAPSLRRGAGEAPPLSYIENKDRPKAVSIMDLDELVQRFILIDDDTGDFVFDTWTHNVVKFSKMTRLMPSWCKVDYIKNHETWQSRAVYVDQIGFDPGFEDSNIICNRFRGWPMQPKHGSCDVMLDLLKYLCSRDTNSMQVYDFVLKWLAYPLQNPGAKMQSAIVMHGNQGTGKSMFFESYAKIFGEYSAILNQGALDDKFNADWAERKLFVIADEVAANSEKYQLKNQLKTLITGDWVRVNPKNVAAHKERNHMNLVFLSNEHMPVVLENDDRRHCIIRTPEALPENYYSDLKDEINNGGIEALYHYLLNLDCTGFGVQTKPPMTLAKSVLIYLSASSEERFLQDWRSGYVPGLPFCPITKQLLYDSYRDWCKSEGEMYARSAKDFTAYLEGRKNWQFKATSRYTSLESRDIVGWRGFIPSDEDMLIAANAGQKDMRKLSNESSTDWLTRCYFEIENAQINAGKKNWTSNDQN